MGGCKQGSRQSPQAPLDPVADDRAAHLARHHEADPRVGGDAAAGVND